nr:uncharacterized protein LOC122172305 [Chrysemys picta bellii]
MSAVGYPRPTSRSRSRSRDHRYHSRSRSARRYSRSWSRRRYSPNPDRHRPMAPPWPSRSPSVVSGTDSDRYGGYGHRSQASRDYSHSQWGQPSQWPFWTPWAYHQQGPPSRASRSRPPGYRSRSPRHRPPSHKEATVSRPPEREGVDSAQSTVLSQSHTAGQAPEEQLVDAGLQDTEEGQKAPTSSSSLDEAVAGNMVSGPPPIDHRAHQDLLRRVALNLGLQAEETVEQEDPMVDILSPEGLSRVALPIIRTVQSNCKTVWQTPASSAPTARGVERKYFAPSRGFDFLFLHPSPCSLVVSAVNERERRGQQAPAPKGKEAKRLDLFGRKVYSSGGLQLRIANQQAILNRHNFNSWASFAKFKDSLPPDAHQEFMALVDEGMAVAKTSLQASLDSADAAARTIASGVVMRRSAWLQASGLPPEVQTTLQDLLFEGSGLFSDQTDARLHSLKDSRATLKSLGMHTPVTQRKPFKPQPPQRQYHPRPRHEPYHRRGRDNSYNLNFWDSLCKFKESLPQNSAQEFGALVEEEADGMKGRPVSPQRISSWITACIRYCYDLVKVPPPATVTAHSTRVKASSAPFLAQVLIQHNCRAATWLSFHTFNLIMHLSSKPEMMLALAEQCCKPHEREL